MSTTHTTTTCKNCHLKYHGNFCSRCGQPAETHDINLHYFWHDIQHGLFHVDKGLLYTARALFTRPGQAVREFIEGKRVSHFKPVAFVFLLSTIYAVLSHYLHIETFLDDFDLVFSNPADRQGGVLSMLSSLLLWLRGHYAYSTLLFIPFFSIASYLAFRKSGDNYMKHLVLNCYSSGQKTIMYLAFMPLEYAISSKSALSGINDIKFYLEIGLTCWLYAGFFRKNTILKNLLLTALTYALLFFLIIIVIVFAAVLVAVLRVV